MFPEKPELSVSIPSTTNMLKMVVEMTKHVATINQFSISSSQKIALAVDEAVTNVIKHSYNNSDKEEIKIDFFTGVEGLKIKITFFGIPPIFNGAKVNLKKLVKNKRKSGLGVELMKKIMDSVQYKTKNDINYCEMVKWK